MVDAGIEFIVPPRRIGAREQGDALVDLIVEIQDAATLLLGAIAADHVGGERQQRQRTVAASDGAAFAAQCLKALRLIGETIAQGRINFLDRIGRQRFAQVSVFREEDGGILVNAGIARRRQSRFESVGFVVIGLRALPECCGKAHPRR